MKSKGSVFIALLALCSLSDRADACCPDGRPVPSGAEEADASCDPAFAFADFNPIKNQADRTAELWSAIHASSGKKSFNLKEKSEWREVIQEMNSGAEKAYASALTVWSQNHSQEFTHMVITKAMAQVRDTSQLENLKFLMACMEDVKTQKQFCLNLAKGNGLERNLAAYRLALMTSNPQFRAN